MAGSRKWFVYTDDLGGDFALNLDESNTEAVNGGTQDLIAGANVPNALPRNVKARRLYYGNQARTRVIRCTALTPAIYQAALQGSVLTITDPIAGGSTTLGLIGGDGESRRLPVPYDTGIDDGDAT